MVKPEDRKTRDYNLIDYSEDSSKQMPEDFDNSVPYIDVNSKRSNRQTVPGLDTDQVSYSPSKTERRGAGGRATMKTYGAQFMRSMDRKYMEGTKDSVWRRYKRMDRDIDYLFRLGKLSTTSPAKFTPEDVHNFISYRMSLDVSDSEMVHELAALSNIFAFIGNDAYRVAVVKYPYLKVSASHKRLPSLHEEECRAIFEAAEKVKDDDWSGMVRYATVVFAICSGLRSKELRFCNVNDVHIKEKWKLHGLDRLQSRVRNFAVDLLGESAVRVTVECVHACDSLPLEDGPYSGQRVRSALIELLRTPKTHPEEPNEP